MLNLEHPNVTALDLAREQLARSGYAILPAHAVLSDAERAALASSLFAADNLERDLPHVHPGRDRTDDLVTYRWQDEQVSVEEAAPNHPDESRIYVQLTRNFSEARHYRRFRALAEPSLARLVTTLLSLVPVARRRPHGIVGLHAIRTQGVVVPVWHRDGNRLSPVDWVVAYVLDRRGGGARSLLAHDRRGTNRVLEHALAPGELLIHRDDEFYHYVTPLEPTAADDTPERTAIIMMIRPPLESRPDSPSSSVEQPQ